jgi:hypothetical protein
MSDFLTAMDFGDPRLLDRRNAEAVAKERATSVCDTDH